MSEEKVEAAEQAEQVKKTAKVEKVEKVEKSKTKIEKKPVESVPEPSETPEVLHLFVGVDFGAESGDETRIEAGIVELGTLPPAFENFLIETKRAQIRLR